jgi:hypothetical protein
MMKAIKLKRPETPEQFEDYAYNAAKGLFMLCGFLLAMILIMAFSISDYRSQIEQINKRIEAAEKRKDEIDKRFQWTFENQAKRIEALEKKGKNK